MTQRAAMRGGAARSSGLGRYLLPCPPPERGGGMRSDRRICAPRPLSVPGSLS